MTTTHTHAPTTTDQTPTTRGHRVELGHYTTDTGHPRVLIGQRIDGIVPLYDEPVHADAPSYEVERRLETNGELQALLADYLTKAHQLGYPPMHGWL